jgi:hypothetical protein
MLTRPALPAALATECQNALGLGLIRVARDLHVVAAGLNEPPRALSVHFIDTTGQAGRTGTTGAWGGLGRKNGGGLIEHDDGLQDDPALGGQITRAITGTTRSV